MPESAQKTVLAIHAHPDDIEILCAGTLALLAKQGHRIRMISMTPGDCGSHEYGPDEIAAIRREEAARSARRIGADYKCAEFRDLEIFSTEAARRRVTGIVREIRPDIVLTASPCDYISDHEATSALVRDACFAAPVPNYKTGEAAPPLRAIPHLYFMDPIAVSENEPRDFFIDIGSVFSTKRDMLAEHRSQRAWLAQHHGIDDYLAQMETWSRRNGAAAGVEYAEGFRQCRRHAYPESPLLQQLLTGYVNPATGNAVPTTKGDRRCR